MANWAQQDMEELIAKMTKKAMTDAEFRKEVLADANKALEKLAGKALPDGMTIKCIERDPNFQNTLVLPDLIDEEKLDEDGLQQVAGGVGFAVITVMNGPGVNGPGITGPDGKMYCGAWGHAEVSNPYDEEQCKRCRNWV